MVTKRHYNNYNYYYLSPAVAGQRREVKAITTSTDGFALMFPSTTLNSPLSIIYLDPILGNNDFLRIHFSFTFQPCILVCSIIQKSVIYMGNFGNNLKVFVVMNDNEVNQKPNFVRVLHLVFFIDLLRA